MPELTIRWRQQSRQLTFLRACGLSHPFEGGGPQKPAARVIGYGGAAGGGKSDALIMAGLIGGLTFPGINIGYFRREYPQLEGPGGAIMRSQELMSSFCKWNGGLRRWVMPTKSVLQFCHCKSEEDVYNYQSQQFDILLFDEATQFTRFQYRYLMTRNRATKGGVIPFAAMGTNPGGEGHAWYLKEFVEIGPPEQPHEVEVEPGRMETHIFIPARLSDNQVLEQRDPNYRATLEAQPDIVRRQLLEGDWTAFAGQYFPEWSRDIHVCKPFEIPSWWKRFRSLDYGLDMTACYWWAVDGEGKLYVYRELYEKDLKLSDAAKKILAMTPASEKISYTVASPDLWNRGKDTGKPNVQVMTDAGLHGMVQADDRRIQGWRQLREYLDPYEGEDGLTANVVLFETCPNLIRTIPLLMHDKTDVEDAASEPHEVTHAPESARYAVMSRPPLRSETPDEIRKRRKAQQRATRPVVSRITGY